MWPLHAIAPETLLDLRGIRSGCDHALLAQDVDGLCGQRHVPPVALGIARCSPVLGEQRVGIAGSVDVAGGIQQLHFCDHARETTLLVPITPDPRLRYHAVVGAAKLVQEAKEVLYFRGQPHLRSPCEWLCRVAVEVFAYGQHFLVVEVGETGPLKTAARMTLDCRHAPHEWVAHVDTGGYARTTRGARASVGLQLSLNATKARDQSLEIQLSEGVSS